MSIFPPLIAVNGCIGERISPLDRGFTYGDGVFETMKFSTPGIALWHWHRRRLEDGCSRLGIALDIDRLLRYREDLLKTAASRDIAEGVMKIIVSRGEGGRGYAIPDPGIEPTICIGLFPPPAYPPHYSAQGVKAMICRQRLSASPQLAGLKHLNKLEHIMARREWRGDTCAEGLLCDDRGMVIEGTATNIFTVSDNRLSTPRLDRCGVDGVMRRVVAEILAPGLGLVVNEIELTRERLHEAQEVFLTNSINGVWPVKSITDVSANLKREYKPGKITRRLQRRLEYYLEERRSAASLGTKTD